MDVDSFLSEKPCVATYYTCTTFRDYTWLHWLLGNYTMHTVLSEESVLYVEKHCKDAQRVLEIGFGKGANSLYLAQQCPAVQFDGVDLLNEHTEFAWSLARQTGQQNVSFATLNVLTEDIPEKDYYDVVFGIESLCHMDSEEAILRFFSFAKEKLKKGGKVVIVDGFRSTHFDQQPEEVKLALRLAERGFRIRQLFSKTRWIQLAQYHGFAYIEEKEWTHDALPFWNTGWFLIHSLLFFPFLIRWYLRSGCQRRKETWANCVSSLLVGYALQLGAAQYGTLVFISRDH
jgi:SAM-dependent methyltransferase